MVNPERFHRLIEDARSADFSGWDFSWLDGRMTQADPPWDYQALVNTHIQQARSMLDMGTGGGEFLASLPKLPPDTHATESFPPNQPIAEQRLTPLGVTTHNTDEDAPLPFDDHHFDLVINKHESYDPAEVQRVLKPGGHFITQQVGGLDNLELNQVLEPSQRFPITKWGLTLALTKLYETNFTVLRAEKAALTTAFADIGSVVYYLKAIPWQVEGFNPDTHQNGLVSIHNIIEKQGHFLTTAHRFLILARIGRGVL